MGDDDHRLRRHRRAAPSRTGEGGIASNLLIVLAEGVDGAAVRALVDEGALPCFARLIEAGVSGDMLPPAAGPMAGWASMATGLLPHHHGLATPFTAREDRAGIAPAGNRDWGAVPFWRTLAEAGHRVALVNLPATIPATVTGVATAVDPRFFAAPLPHDGEWPLPPRCVQPPALRATLRPARIHPHELDGEDLGGLPADALAEAGAIQAVTLHLLVADDRPDVTVVACPIAARAPCAAALHFLDRALDTLIGAGGQDMDLILASPGGLVLAVGEGFTPDTLRHGIRPQDIAATVLASRGLPFGGGRPLNGMRAEPLPRGTPVPIWQEPPDGPEAIRQVGRARALALAMSAMDEGDYGYAANQLEGLAAARPDHPQLLLLLGQCRFHLEQWSACLAAGIALATIAPEQPWGVMMQAAGLLMTGCRPEAEPLLARAAEQAKNDPVALCRLGALLLRAGDPAIALAHYAAALALAPQDADALAGVGLAQLASGNLADGERRLKASLGQRFDAPALHHQLALLYVHQGRWEEATSAVATAREQAPGLVDLEALGLLIARRGMGHASGS